MWFPKPSGASSGHAQQDEPTEVLLMGDAGEAKPAWTARIHRWTRRRGGVADCGGLAAVGTPMVGVLGNGSHDAIEFPTSAFLQAWRKTVGRRPYHRLGTDRALRAWPILDDERLTAMGKAAPGAELTSNSQQEPPGLEAAEPLRRAGARTNVPTGR